MLIATGIVAELGDLRRFDHLRKLISYLGLVCKEDSSDDKRALGSITKCGNGRARRLLVQGGMRINTRPTYQPSCKNDKRICLEK